MATNKSLPKGMVLKKELTKAMKSIPQKIAEIEQQKLLEKAVTVKDAIKECFETHPSLLDLTVSEIQSILNSLGIESSTATIYEIKTEVSERQATPNATNPSENKPQGESI